MNKTCSFKFYSIIYKFCPSSDTGVKKEKRRNEKMNKTYSFKFNFLIYRFINICFFWQRQCENI